MTFNVLYLNEAVNAGFSLVFCVMQLCADLDLFLMPVVYKVMQHYCLFLRVHVCVCVRT